MRGDNYTISDILSYGLRGEEVPDEIIESINRDYPQRVISPQTEGATDIVNSIYRNEPISPAALRRIREGSENNDVHSDSPESAQDIIDRITREEEGNTPQVNRIYIDPDIGYGDPGINPDDTYLFDPPDNTQTPTGRHGLNKYLNWDNVHRISNGIAGIGKSIVNIPVVSPYPTGKLAFNISKGEKEEAGFGDYLVGVTAFAGHTAGVLYLLYTIKDGVPSLGFLPGGGEDLTNTSANGIGDIIQRTPKNATDIVTPADILKNESSATAVYANTPSGAQAYIGTDPTGASIIEGASSSGNDTTAIAKAERIIYIPPNMNVSEVIDSLKMVARS
ncbi:MAG: hypothetical protein KAH93_03190 [Candidatus Aenigmarchaeota archaeon]|nr:hypothetical protein [Candidatus Aenigmarchaeota archaeon]